MHPEIIGRGYRTEILRRFLEAALAGGKLWFTTHGDLASRLQSYAAGNDERFDDVPLDLAHLSVFQNRVVSACRRISRGRDAPIDKRTDTSR